MFNLPLDYLPPSLKRLSVDCHFKMKRRHVSSLEKDPPLSDGLGYLTKEEPYRAYLKKSEGVVQEVRLFSIMDRPHL